MCSTYPCCVGVADGEPLRVFISYRREDSIGTAGRIRDGLASRFGDVNVFFDVDTIPLGVDFRRHIDRMVAECNAMLVVIGPRWLDAVDDHGRRRLDQPEDFVRLELEAALRRDIPVIPLLVDAARMPEPGQLPESVGGLAFRNGMPVRHDPDFHADVDRLSRRLSAMRPVPATSGDDGSTRPAGPGGGPAEARETSSHGRGTDAGEATRPQGSRAAVLLFLVVVPVSILAIVVFALGPSGDLASLVPVVVVAGIGIASIAIGLSMRRPKT